MTERRCENCRKPYQPRQYNQRFCSGTCNDAWRHAEQRRAIELLRNTYFGRELLSEDRHAALGSEPMTLPVADWCRDPVPTEPPLGVDVGAVPDLGFPEGRNE